MVLGPLASSFQFYVNNYKSITQCIWTCKPTLSPKVDRIACIWTHFWANFVCICISRSSTTLTRQTCQIVILLRLCITSSCSSQENATPPCTHQHATTMFGLLNSPHYTNNNTCKAIWSWSWHKWTPIEEGPCVGGSYKACGSYCKLYL
jgi:hypothetical protein